MEERKLRYNIYDRMLSVSIALQIFGGYGGAVQPVRVFILLITPFALVYLNKKQILSNYYKYESRYFMVFLIYAIVSALFVRDQVAAMKELLYLAINFSSFFVIIYLSFRSINAKKSIINGWIILFILSIPIALVEIVFDYHLPISLLQSDEVIGGMGEARRSASVTFGNYNAYNVMLIYIFPFLAASLLLSRKFIIQILTWLIILFLIFIVITNASRGSLLCISITFVIFLFYYLRSKVKGRYVFIVSLSAVVSYFVIKYFDAMFMLISYRLTAFGIQDSTRSELISNSIILFFNSYCLGVGTGNFQAAMSQYHNADIVAPHNFFLEIAVQYGLFIFIGFIILLIRLFKKARTEKIRTYRFIVFTSLLIYPIASVIDSGYIEGISVWMQLGSLFIVADPKFSFSTNLKR